MLASSVLQPRKSEVKHGVRHREQPRKQGARRQRANRNTTPNTSATASIARESRTPYARQNPQHAPGPTSARQAPERARPPSAPDPPARQNPRRAPEPASACQSPQRMPEPPTRARTPARAGTKTWWVRCRPCSGEPSPQRTPGRKPGSGALIEPTIGLRDANRATRRVPRALAGPSSESPRRRIVNFVRPWSKQAILRSLKAKTRDYLRYREAHARTTDKNVHFSLPRPRKTVCFDRQRPKPTVFRIAHPPRQPNPMLNKQHSRHRSRRWRASSPGLRTLITGIGFYHHRDWSGVTIPEFCRILDAFLRH